MKNKTASSKPSHTTQRPAQRAKAIPFEVVSDIPDLTPPKVLEHVKSVEKVLKGSDKLSAPEILGGIRSYARQAEVCRGGALAAGASAIVFAWACGKLLITAKRKLGRGEFGIWREKYLSGTILSERTSSRYMKLASQYDDVKTLLEWNTSLRQAYIACGVLPEPPERAEEEPESNTEESKKKALLSSITDMRRKLRSMSELKTKLAAAEKNQLRRTRKELDALFDALLG